MTDERTPMVVSGGTATVLMSAREVRPRLPQIRSALAGPDPVVGFLSVLTGAGVHDLPSFACIGREADSVRLLLRGRTSAIVRGHDGQETAHDAGSVSTWVETVAAGCAEVELLWEGAPVAIVSFEPVTVLDGHVAAAQLTSATSTGDGDAAPTGGMPAPDLSPPADVAPGAVAEVPGEVPGPRPGPSEALTRPPEPPHSLGAEAPVPEVRGTHAPPLLDEAEEVDLSHLFETRHVGVEAAAVRADGEGDGASESEAAIVPSPVAASAPPLAPSQDVSAPVHLLPPPTGAPVDVPPPPGLISGVPRSGPAMPEPNELGDHDGLTISPAQAAALRRGSSSGRLDPARGAQLQAVTCPSGHLNPPQAAECRTCLVGIQDHSIRLVHRPSLGHLRFESGLVADIDRPLLVGRKPTAEGLVPGDEVPGLVSLPDPDGMLSRVHLEIRIEGWEVLVVDRGSTNGTIIEVPGQSPVRLRPMEPVLITRGTRITLADAVGCTFETGSR